MTAAAERVEVRHVSTGDEWVEALRAHAKVSSAARRKRWFAIVATLVLVAMSVRITPEGGSLDPVGLGIAALLLLSLLVLMPRAAARAQQRNHAALGERRITVDESGVCVETAHTLSRTRWSALSRYVETRRLFVLFSADKQAACLICVPKRSADGSDRSKPLRALRDAHLVRAGDPRR
ncbi:YcxB family protein [Streptomyces sp. CAI-85]|uniref:YcxB family protein n=1 Tax=Streptomyces sp. CAI-85 TaxID=1472662 RepID=UPI001587283F|nr:YcxB family protein [Streptomyces sp. CAI-85]NUV65042.1 YcxB family protein [Streptomyces sp. CAI-85]